MTISLRTAHDHFMDRCSFDSDLPNFVIRSYLVPITSGSVWSLASGRISSLFTKLFRAVKPSVHLRPRAQILSGQSNVILLLNRYLSSIGASCFHFDTGRVPNGAGKAGQKKHFISVVFVQHGRLRNVGTGSKYRRWLWCNHRPKDGVLPISLFGRGRSGLWRKYMSAFRRGGECGRCSQK